jgi:hypothetical protein
MLACVRRGFCRLGLVAVRIVVKWSGKFGQRAKMYPARTNGCENDKATEFSDPFKAAVALEALRGDKTVQEIAAKRQLHLLFAGKH